MLWMVYGGDLVAPGGDVFQDPRHVEVLGLYETSQDAYDAWKARSFSTIDNAHRQYVIAEYIPDQLPEPIRWGVIEHVAQCPSLLEMVRRDVARQQIAEDRAGEAAENEVLAAALDERPPYYGYQVSVAGRMIQLQDITLEDARLALVDALDTLEDLDDFLIPVTDRIESWRQGRTFKQRGVPYYYYEDGDLTSIVQELNGFKTRGRFVDGVFKEL